MLCLFCLVTCREWLYWTHFLKHLITVGRHFLQILMSKYFLFYGIFFSDIIVEWKFLQPYILLFSEFHALLSCLVDCCVSNIVYLGTRPAKFHIKKMLILQTAHACSAVAYRLLQLLVPYGFCNMNETLLMCFFLAGLLHIHCD